MQRQDKEQKLFFTIIISQYNYINAQYNILNAKGIPAILKADHVSENPDTMEENDMCVELFFEEERCSVGEGPVWDDRREELLFLDIWGKCIYVVEYENGKTKKLDVGQQIGCFALCENGDLLVALEDGIYRMDGAGKMTLAHQPIKIKGRRFNDGKVGPDGCFYAGTTDDQKQGAFYRLQDGVLTELFDGCGCSNGLDWTVDETKMIYCDTVTQSIERFDFDKEAHALSNRKIIANIPKEMGKPDGLAMDEEDGIWLALWDGGAIVRIDSSKGEILSKWDIPAAKASSCCFAGKNLDELIITTASIAGDAEKYPLAGYCFKMYPEVKGKKVYRYRY